MVTFIMRQLIRFYDDELWGALGNRRELLEERMLTITRNLNS